MAVSLGDIVVRFLGDTSSLTRGVEESQGALGGLGGLAGGVGGMVAAGLAVAGTAAIGFAAASVKSAGDFQQSMLKVQAYAGLSKSQMDAMSASIMSLSGQVAQSPKALADAIYPIISSGYGATDALNILSLSAKTAAASGAQTSTVADMLTTSLGAMHAPASQATQYMDQFNKIVALGKGEVPQYAAVIGKLSLAAGSAHIDFGTMGAALADLTTHGFPSVSQASTALGNLFTQFGPKVDAVATHAQKLGLSFDENAFKTMSLSEKLAYLKEITGGNEGELLKLVGGNALALKAFDALSGSSQTLTNNLHAMANANGTTAASFATASQGFNFQMQRMQASFEVVKVAVGNALLPALTSLAQSVTPLITNFANWETQTHGVEKGIAAVGAALAVTRDFITGVVMAVMAWQTQTQAIGTTLSTLSAILGGLETAGLVVWTFIRGIGGDILTVLHPALLILSVAWQGLVSSVQRLMVAFAPLAPTGILLAKVIGGILVVALGLAIGVVAGLATGLAYFLTGIVTVISGIVQVFTGLVTFIGGILEVLQGLFTGNDDLILKGIGDMARGIESIIEGIGTVAIGLFTAIVGTIVGIVSGFVTAVVSYFVTLYNVLVGHSIIPDLVNGMIGWFAQLPGRAISAIAGLVSGLGSFFSSLAGLALTWGRNLIGGFVNGIMGMTGAVGNAVSSVGNTIKNFLGIHSPAKMGPLAEADQWGPNLAKMYAGGMTSGLPAITNASTTLATPLAAGGRNASSTRTQTAHIHVYLGGKEIVSQLMPMVYDEARAMTGWRPVG